MKIFHAEPGENPERTPQPNQSQPDVQAVFELGAAALVGTDRRAVCECLYSAPSGRALPASKARPSPNAMGRCAYPERSAFQIRWIVAWVFENSLELGAWNLELS